MPRKSNKSTASNDTPTTLTPAQLRTLRNESVATVTLHVTHEYVKQKQRQLECIKHLDETYEHLKRKRQEPTGVSQSLNAVMNRQINDYKLLMAEKVPGVIPEEQIEEMLAESKRSREKCAVVLGEVAKRLKETNKLINAVSQEYPRLNLAKP